VVWKPRKALFVLAFCNLACSGEEDATAIRNIFGDDNRIELNPHAYPDSAVGRLEGGCSGAIIGKRLAMTAAHCVLDDATGNLKSELAYFKSGYRDGSYRGISWISGAWLGTTKPVAQRKSDWAILHLAQDLGSTTGWFGSKLMVPAHELPLTVSLAGLLRPCGRQDR
jgi:protease YdgD